MKQRAHIGKTVAEKSIVIEAGLVQRFVDALEEDAPLSKDRASARAAGLNEVMLPHVGAGSLGDYDAVTTLLELRPKQVLHSRETIAVHQPLCVGDELSVTTTIRDLYEKQAGGGNPMGFVVIDVVGTTKKDLIAFEVQ
ncbi:MAG: FAS1-like dehydratase domain-containing protein, partial [Myxococcota bacterium]